MGGTLFGTLYINSSPFFNNLKVGCSNDDEDDNDDDDDEDSYTDSSD